MSETTPTRKSLAASLASSPLVVWFNGLIECLSVLRAPIVMSTIVVLVLWLPDQTKEVYRVLVQLYMSEEASELRWQWLLTVIALFLLSMVLWQVTRELTHAASERHDLDRLPVAKFVFDWSPRVLATAPFIGAALGLWYSWGAKGIIPESLPPKPEPGSQLEAVTAVITDLAKLESKLTDWAYGAAVIAILIFLAITAFERWLLRIEPRRPLTQARGRKFLLVNYWFVFPLVGAISIVAFARFPITLPQTFGVIPIFALWAAVVTGLASAGTRFQDVSRIPVVTIAIVAAFVFGFLSLNDNHKFRSIEGVKSVPRIEVGEAFKQWIMSRKDIDAYKGKKKYPVYVVAAEGGGAYAAYHTAKILSRLQDMCENFAQHVFAVSAVSGGSIGAAVFAALAQGGRTRNSGPKPCEERYVHKDNGFEAEVERVVSRDFLSPLAWAGLFPDFLQRFLPVPIYSLDRAVALEKSLEDAWRARSSHRQSEPNPFSESFFALCSPGSQACAPQDVAAPALLLNMTNIETGMQMVLSPLFLGNTYISNVGIIEDFYRKSHEIRPMSLSTAVGLSARFPWVLPVGWHKFSIESERGRQDYRMSFGDGGYYEGSGVITAENVVQHLQWYLTESPDRPNLGDLEVSFKIIMVTGNYQPVDRFFNTEQDIQSFGEFATPLAAYLQAWRTRSAAVPVEVAADQAKGAPYAAKAAQFDYELFPVPLGLQLGKLSYKYLDLFSGRPENCGAVPSPDLDPVIQSVLLSMNSRDRGPDCLVKYVIDDLKPDLPATASKP